MEVYKIMRVLERVNAQSLFPRVGESRTKWYRGATFSHSQQYILNELPDEMAEAGQKQHLKDIWAGT